MHSIHRRDLVLQARAWAEFGEHGKSFARVRLIVGEEGREVTLDIHESLVYSNTINVEIDGDFADDRPSLRINLNDCLIHDSTRNDPPLESPRSPDLQE